jgi:hypothetical protein
MKTYPLLIPKNIILPISILGFIFTVIGTLLKLSHWSFGIFTPNLVLSISMVFTLLAIFVVLLDIIKNPIKNKFLWIIPLLFVGNIVSMIYLINRESHIRRALR